MRTSRRGLGIIAALAMACGPRSSEPKPTTEPESASAMDGSETSDAEVRVGDQLDASIPLFDGGALALDRLRGQVVVLDLSGTWQDTWLDNQHLYRRLAGEYGTDLVVVTVALDPDRSQLQAHWERDPLPFVLGWDPQGALAAKLRVGALPTVVLIDDRGVVAGLWTGFGPAERERLQGRIVELLGPR